MERTRVHLFGQIDCDLRRVATEALLGSEIQVESGPMGSRGTGICFFDDIDEALCEALWTLSRGGLIRVLAVRRLKASGSEGWCLLASGASDVLTWKDAPTFVHQVKGRLERWQAIDELVDSAVVRSNLVGESPVWKSLLRQLVEVARFTDASVLLAGETGTGKELAARLIHTLDFRPDKRDLVILDCTTVVPELAGSEFFGHERGAFTGAASARDGCFALADRGTLFLDEVGDLPLPLQAQLLRVCQERTYKRVGGNSYQSTAFRLVCATNHDLLAGVAQQRFRADLYYRIATVLCRVPPLRERREDILPLARHFLSQLRPDEEPPEIEPAVAEHLVERDYPGNVRDLKQLVTRIYPRHVGAGPITPGDLPPLERPARGLAREDWRDEGFTHAIRRALRGGVGLKDIGRGATEAAIRIALREEDDNLQRAAQRLGVTDRALQMRRARPPRVEVPRAEAS